MRAEPLLITLGDANGLGPELACRLLSGPLPDHLAGRALLLLGAEASLLAHLSLAEGTPFWTRVDDPARALAPSGESGAPGVYLYEPPGLDGIRVQVGQATPDGGRAAGVALSTACDLLLAPASPGVRSLRGPLGLVTLPLHKAMLHAAGYDVPGHTEYLARRAGLGDDEVCMHLGGDVLRVSLVTTHPPLRDVPGLITRQRVLHCLRLTAAHVRAIRAIRAIGATGPVAVCGLNPHAGESGRIGREEIDVIAPAVADAVAEGLDVVGPLPADTLFVKAARGAYSAVLAMYHDQGLAPLKMLHFSDAVNVTLGLPFVRTSVDHGTGFDIAGTGTADTGSFAAALRLACTLCDAKD
ncbi:4-hydroxythreonine-4-phosphate dehydrogenase PdxA [Nitratidesulfovibrio sp. 1201_IL3209]|uniref:4-hydroxythreonine-4-phosphate dehydrogenase PdxA n=1 Tax=Nitratidesulfovibrio sp. 1201_IL3209 TaxID=3084053 RepID=UPI002FD96289